MKKIQGQQMFPGFSVFVPAKSVVMSLVGFNGSGGKHIHDPDEFLKAWQSKAKPEYLATYNKSRAYFRSVVLKIRREWSKRY